MKKWNLVIVVQNGMRLIVTDASDKRNIKMFEEASKLLKKRG